MIVLCVPGPWYISSLFPSFRVCTLVCLSVRSPPITMWALLTWWWDATRMPFESLPTSCSTSRGRETCSRGRHINMRWSVNSLLLKLLFHLYTNFSLKPRSVLLYASLQSGLVFSTGMFCKRGILCSVNRSHVTRCQSERWYIKRANIILWCFYVFVD